MTEVTIRRPTRRRPVFHRLTVAAIDRLTDDALALTFLVPAPLRQAFAFQAGQHVTVRLGPPPDRPAEPAGADVRRSYSLCSTPDELAGQGRLRIGVKVLPQGAFSRFAADRLAVGDEVEVMPPLGRFTTAFDRGRPPRWYAAVAAGSGITPILSLIATGLAVEPASRFSLLYGNRYARSVMFSEELADLKDRWPDRLQVSHVLSREPGPAELLSGRIDAERLPRLIDTFVPGPVDEWFLCGPYRMVLEARGVLAERGVPEAAVHTEVFHVPDDEPGAASTAPAGGPPAGSDAGGEVAVRMVLDGRESSFSMGREERVLDAALRIRGELPFACRGGVCGTCRAKVVDGEVTMARNWALRTDELAAGYTLTCQAQPAADRLTVDYDA